ncbi:MarR family winged helix-turn-helix transcriptional regulator [Actinocorallia longicatena]|uniref:HTH marR-type domain-containing protein n=1 Tax=Actinocorallia longicatena TaxID=111803 RepID=A0ABP6Q717_9ACTN
MSGSGEDSGVHEGDDLRTPERLRTLSSRLLSLLSAQAERLVGEGLAEVGARKWHYAVLASLQEYGPGSQAALSRKTGIYRSDMVGVLNELEGDGLVERAPDPGDRRRNVITITGSGRERLHRLDAILDGLHEELLAPLDQAERDRFVGTLTLLLDHHTRARRAVSPPARTP